MKKIKFLLPVIITIVFMLIIYYINGLYPFGNNSIIQVDADYQHIPVLYHIYDIIHGVGNTFYSNIGFGNNIYIAMIIQGSIFSPLTLLLYLTTRENIVNYFDIILLVKLSLISLTAYIYIDKSYKIKYFYKILFSILYTFNGYILFNYFSIMWLDDVILFPLIILYLNKLINEDKYIGYIITLSLSLIISYYVTYFILIFIFFYSFIYIFIIVKNNRKKIINRLGISTIISIMISAFSTFPAIYQTLISSRFSNEWNSNLVGDIINKSMYILVLPLFIIIFIALISKYNEKKYKKKIYLYIALLLLFIVGIIIEPINLTLHGGSYWDFPYRYGFITSFIMMIGSCYYLENFKIKSFSKMLYLRIVLLIYLMSWLIYINYNNLAKIKNEFIMLDFDNFEIYKVMLLMIGILVVLYIIAITFKNKYLKYISLSLVAISNIFICSSWTMYYSDGYFLTRNANNINNNMKLRHDGKYKIDYTVYCPDYGFIMNVDTLDNWLHIIPKGQEEVYSKLGYSTDDSIRSYGGTIFTDWLFNIKYLLSDKQKDSELYELIDTYENKYLYEYKYNIPNGIPFNKQEKIELTSNSFNNQNNIYKNLFDRKDNIIKVDLYTNDNDPVGEKTNDIYIEYNIEELGILYLQSLDYDNIDFIEINNNDYIHNIGDYIKEIGTYNSDLKIRIHLKSNNYTFINLGFIKINDIMNLNNNNVVENNNKYHVKNTNNKFLFIPINNIPGIKITNNNKIVDTYKYIDNFLVIKLNKGDNYIEVKYDMPLYKVGIIISILGFILLILFKYIKVPNIIININYYSFYVLGSIIYIYFYIYPLIRFILLNRE